MVSQESLQGQWISATGSPKRHLSSSFLLNSSVRKTLPDKIEGKILSSKAKFGITRVTDITRLDKIGIPVFVTVRPFGKILSVNSGKGATPLEAKISAIMESIEFHCAENYNPLDHIMLSPREFTENWSGDVLDYCPPLQAGIKLDEEINFVMGYDILQGDYFPSPIELVAFNPDFHRIFGSENGTSKHPKYLIEKAGEYLTKLVQEIRGKC